MLESPPIIKPKTKRPNEPGKSRVALGLRLRNNPVAVNAAKIPKINASSEVDMPLIMSGTPIEPMRMPGESLQNTGHSTALCTLCARTLEIDVNTIVAIDVATEICKMCSGGKCS